jgi:hypothetical protein
LNPIVGKHGIHISSTVGISTRQITVAIEDVFSYLDFEAISSEELSDLREVFLVNGTSRTNQSHSIAYHELSGLDERL